MLSRNTKLSYVLTNTHWCAVQQSMHAFQVNEMSQQHQLMPVTAIPAIVYENVCIAIYIVIWLYVPCAKFLFAPASGTQS